MSTITKTKTSEGSDPDQKASQGLMIGLLEEKIPTQTEKIPTLKEREVEKEEETEDIVKTEDIVETEHIVETEEEVETETTVKTEVPTIETETKAETTVKTEMEEVEVTTSMKQLILFSKKWEMMQRLKLKINLIK